MILLLLHGLVYNIHFHYKYFILFCESKLQPALNKQPESECFVLVLIGFAHTHKVIHCII